MIKVLRYTVMLLGVALGLSSVVSPAFAQAAPTAGVPVAQGAVPVTPPPGPIVASTPAPAATPAATGANEGYVLGPGDVIEIAVLGRDEFRPRVQVQIDGTVQLPYLHSVKASDLTVIQLRNQVTKMLREGGFYTDPVVNVAVVSYASRYVTVLGEFGTPGLVPVDRAYRVSEILARVGGARATAADDILLRRIDGQELRLPLSSVSRGGVAEDPFVQPGDKLFLPTAPIFYVYGQVGAPGAYKLERGMTVRMALARGGGLTPRGSPGKVSVYRGGAKIKVNLDMPVLADDTLYIGERFF